MSSSSGPCRPITNWKTPPDPYSQFYASASYYAQFICVDGSGATLHAPGDINSISPNVLTYQDGYFTYIDFDSEFASSEDYDPTTAGNHLNDMTLITADNHVYQIDAAARSLLSSEDPSGNLTTYNADGSSASQTGTNYQLVISPNPDGTIHEAYVEAYLNGTHQQVGNAVVYSYTASTAANASSPLLHSVTNQDGLTTTYIYGTSNPGQQNYLVNVNNSIGVCVLTATYNTAGMLTSLVGANDNPATVGTNAPGNGTGSETVSSPNQQTPRLSTTATETQSGSLRALSTQISQPE